jgi:hypothetical protein
MAGGPAKANLSHARLAIRRAHQHAWKSTRTGAQRAREQVYFTITGFLLLAILGCILHGGSLLGALGAGLLTGTVALIGAALIYYLLILAGAPWRNHRQLNLRISTMEATWNEENSRHVGQIEALTHELAHFTTRQEAADELRGCANQLERIAETQRKHSWYSERANEPRTEDAYASSWDADLDGEFKRIREIASAHGLPVRGTLADEQISDGSRSLTEVEERSAIGKEAIRQFCDSWGSLPDGLGVEGR